MKMRDRLPPFRLIITAVVVTVLTYFPVGYHHAVLNVAHETFQKLINDSYSRRYNGGEQITHGRLSSIWSITVSSWQIGALFGSLNTFWMIDLFGRKLTLLLVTGLFQAIGSLFMIVSLPRGYFELLIAGRVLSGFSTGLVCPSLRVFLSECSPDRYRGTLNSLAGFVMAVAIVSAMALGMPQVWGTGMIGHAQLLLGLCLPLALLQFAVYRFFPSTPKFLYLTRKLGKEARESIRFYHGSSTQADIDRAIRELEREGRLQQLSFGQALRSKAVRFPLIVSMIAGVAYSSVGVDVVDSYSTEMFVELGMPGEESKLASMLFNVTGILGAIVSIFVVDRVRRRTLLLSTLFVCVLCNIGLAVIGAVIKSGLLVNDPGDGDAASSMGRICGITSASLIALMTFACALGPAAVLESLFAEISPHKVRAVAGTVSEASFWSTNSFYVFAFHPATVSVGTCAVLIYTIPLLLCTVYFAYRLPETCQKSVSDVAEEMFVRRGDGGGGRGRKRTWRRNRGKSDNAVSTATTIATTTGQEQQNVIDDDVEDQRHLLQPTTQMAAAKIRLVDDCLVPIVA